MSNREAYIRKRRPLFWSVAEDKLGMYLNIIKQKPLYL